MANSNNSDEDGSDSHDDGGDNLYHVELMMACSTMAFQLMTCAVLVFFPRFLSSEHFCMYAGMHP